MKDTKKLKELKNFANTLPLTPGVYIMHDKSDHIIYIGKAKALKNRVTQYFGSDTNHNEKVRKMVEHVDHFEYILCDTEFEAFLLENSLIKQHKPKYNILLKDDKGYHYIKITAEKWRRIFWTMQKSDDGAKYIGPYNSAYVVRNTVDEVQKVFKLPTCNRSFDKPSKPCLNYHIGICSAPCRGKLSINEYDEQIDGAIGFIKKGGCHESDLGEIERRMTAAAEKLDFETAARLRDRMRAVRGILQRQKVITSLYPMQDVFAIVSAGNIACVQLLKFRDGHLSDQKHFVIEDITDKDELYAEFLPRYYSETTDIPPRVVMDYLPSSAALTKQWLSEKSGHNVHLTVPKIGEQKKLVDMCQSNAAENLSKRLESTGRETRALNELAELLGLKTVPRYIESYDISNTGGSQNVAAMVVFLDGKPLRNAYRRFMIKGFSGQDDFRSMAEVLDRRFKEYEKGEDSAFSRLPDLILLDGGKGQISAVAPILKSHDITVPLFGMVKDSHHRTRAIASGGEDIAIKPTRRAYTLVTQIQDETHRSAISYHRQKRSRSMLESELLKIEGIGPARAKILHTAFRSVTALSQASSKEIAEVKGMNTVAADKVYQYFHQEKQP